MKRQLCEPAEVLGDGCERELELRAGRSAQSQPPQSENALQVREQHLDLLAITPRLLIRGGLGDGAGDITRGLVDAARDLALRRARAARGFQRSSPDAYDEVGQYKPKKASGTATLNYVIQSLEGRSTLTSQITALVHKLLFQVFLKFQFVEPSQPRKLINDPAERQ